MERINHALHSEMSLHPQKGRVRRDTRQYIQYELERVRIEGISDPTPKRKPSTGVGHKTAG